MKNKIIKNKFNNILFFSLSLLLIISFIIINTFSKYYASWQISESKKVTSQLCNFESDGFNNGQIKSAEPMIFFGVRNYDNNVIWTDSDIQYSISIKSGEEIVNDLNIEPSFDNNVRTLKGGMLSEDIIKITGFPDNITSKEYKITVSMSSPYVKTIESTYTVTHLPDIELCETDIDSNPPYMFINIKTNDFTGTKPYTVTWDTTKEIPDITDPYVGKFTGGSGTINLLPNSSYKLRFITVN